MSRIDLERGGTDVTGAANGLCLAAAERITASGGQAVLRDADSSAIKSAPAELATKARGRTVELIDEASVIAATVAAKRIAEKKEMAKRPSLGHAGEGCWRPAPLEPVYLRRPSVSLKQPDLPTSPSQRVTPPGPGPLA